MNDRRPRFWGKVEVLNPAGTQVYLRRWCLVRFPKAFSIRLHHILLPDDERAPHDHPWGFVSLIVRGGYTEEWSHAGFWSRRRFKAVKRFSFHRKTDLHQIKGFYRPSGAWSLVITGPERRVWGFQTEDKWVTWKDYEGAGG